MAPPGRAAQAPAVVATASHSSSDWRTPPVLTTDDLATVRGAYPRISGDVHAPPPGGVLAHPAVVAVSRYALAHAIDTAVQALPRPLTIYPEAGTEHLRNGVVRTWSVDELGAWLRERAGVVIEKGAGPFLAPGPTKNGGRKDEDCAALAWLGVECDGLGDWHQILTVLDILGLAYVAYRTPSHTETKPKWRILIPLARPFVPSGELDADRRRWKGQLYPAARLVLGAIAGLDKIGLDPSTDALLNRFYPPSRRPEHRDQPPREVVVHRGAGLDMEAMLGVLEALGCAPAGGKRGRTSTGTYAPEWTGEGEHPFVAALRAAGRVGRRIAENRWVVQCPWEHEHTGGKPGDTSTIVFTNGTFKCSHTHCRGRTARDALETLPPELRDPAARLVLASKAYKRVVAGLQPAQPTTDKATAYTEGLDALRAIRSGEPLLNLAGMGVGKTHAAVTLACERAGQFAGETIIACRDHVGAVTVLGDLRARGVQTRYARGVLAVKHPDETLVCRYEAAVREAQERGVPARAALCRSRWRGFEIGTPCEHVDDCEAARPYEGGAHAPVTVCVHAMLPKVCEDFPRAVLIVDETPSANSCSATLTPESLRAARGVLGKLWGRKRAADLDMVAGVLEHALQLPGVPLGPVLDMPAAVAAFVGTKDGAETVAVHRKVHGRPEHGPVGDVWAAALDWLSRADAPDAGAPLLPGKNELAQLRRSKHGPAFAASADAWRTLEALVVLFGDRALQVMRNGTALEVEWRSPVWEAIRKHDRVAILDATAAPGMIAAQLGKEPKVIRAAVADAADVRRTVYAVRDANRSTWCPDSKPRWVPSLRGAVRALVEMIRRDVPAGATVVWCTFKPLARALQTAWGDNEGEAVPLLAPLRDHGCAVRWTYYGAPDSRGSNVHADADVSVSLGDPNPNVDGSRREAEAFGLDPHDHLRTTAEAILGQFAERLRGVQRTGTLWSYHAGTLVPAGGRWTEESTRVEAPRVGRPVDAVVDARESVRRLVAALGGQRAAAKAIGCGESTIRRVLGGLAVSAELGNRIAKAVSDIPDNQRDGAPQSPVQKEEVSMVPVPDFMAQQTDSNSERLQNTAGDENTLPEPSPLAILLVAAKWTADAEAMLAGTQPYEYGAGTWLAMMQTLETDLAAAA